jgi:hypothetical protein
MSDAMNLTEIDGQHVELLPARTVLSVFVTSGGGSCPGTTQTGGLAGAGSQDTGALGLAGALGAPVGNPGAGQTSASC